jgi:predicted 3-demethylubiquinone-9 3-methyltransferase (glyoxalase superfamily)
MSALASYPRVTPFLWFDSNAEEAADFYVSIFKNSRRISAAPMLDGVPHTAAKVITVSFELDGQIFTALNGGPLFKFNESVSFVVRCDNQQDIDYYWAKLTAGGEESQCGWLKDKFGLSWQVVPGALPDLIRHPAALAAMMKMKKLDIAELERAAKG